MKRMDSNGITLKYQICESQVSNNRVLSMLPSYEKLNFFMYTNKMSGILTAGLRVNII